MATGWHARSAVLNDGDLSPTKEDLKLTVLFNTRLEPNGFTLALVRPNYAVDALGATLVVSDSDLAAFEEVIAEAKKLPIPEGGQWRVKQAATDFPIDRIFIPGAEETSVYGWSATTDELEEETNGYKNLPGPLNVLLGWAREARDGYVFGERDNTVISKILAIVSKET